MIDDPLALVLYVVTVMAGGMYPLGFLFGACSACCDDECPDECSKCAGIYHYDALNDETVCKDTFDLLTLDTLIDSVNKANVATDTNNKVNIAVDFLEDLTCTDIPDPVTLFLRAEFFEPDGVAADACGCSVCAFRQFFIMGGRYGETSETFDNVSCEFNVTFTYDKCSQTSVVLALTLTKQQIEDCLNVQSLGGQETTCADIPDTVDITVTFDLDYECECGACCRDGVCTENESESYCEYPDFFFGGADAGEWQGTGTDCDPNPCPQPEEE